MSESPREDPREPNPDTAAAGKKILEEYMKRPRTSKGLTIPVPRKEPDRPSSSSQGEAISGEPVSTVASEMKGTRGPMWFTLSFDDNESRLSADLIEDVAADTLLAEAVTDPGISSKRESVLPSPERMASVPVYGGVTVEGKKYDDLSRDLPSVNWQLQQILTLMRDIAAAWKGFEETTASTASTWVPGGSPPDEQLKIMDEE